MTTLSAMIIQNMMHDRAVVSCAIAGTLGVEDVEQLIRYAASLAGVAVIIQVIS